MSQRNREVTKKSCIITVKLYNWSSVGGRTLSWKMANKDKQQNQYRSMRYHHFIHKPNPSTDRLGLDWPAWFDFNSRLVCQVGKSDRKHRRLIQVNTYDHIRCDYTIMYYDRTHQSAQSFLLHPVLTGGSQRSA